MVAVIAIVVVIMVILLIGVPWALKSTVDMEKDSHDHLLDPDTPKVEYSVPNGIDAAVICSALNAEGFTTGVSLVAGDELVLVESPPGEREHVRDVITSVTHREYGGLKLHAVTFADEH